RSAPLSRCGMRSLKPLICPTAQARYFSLRNWTAQIALNRHAKPAFGRKQIPSEFSKPNVSRIVRAIGAAVNLDRLARSQLMSAESQIGIKREVADRERADDVEDPDRQTFHQAII